MAFPVVAASNESAVTTAGTSHAVALPTGIVSGNLLLIWMAFASATTPSLAGWTAFGTGGGNQTLQGFYRIANGSEGATATFTTTTSVKSAHVSYRITGHDPATPPTGSNGSQTSATPNPPLHTPAGGAKDFLWFSVLRQAGEEADDDTWVSVFPSGYANGRQVTSGITGAASVNCSIAACYKTANAASDDPGTYTVAQSLLADMTTVSVFPGSSGTAWTKAIADSAGLVDAVADKQNFVVAKAELATISDAVGRVSATKRSFADVGGLVDSSSYVKSGGSTRAIADSAGLLDALAFARTVRKTIADLAGIDDPAGGGGGGPIVFTNLGASTGLVAVNPDLKNTADAASYANTTYTPPTSGLALAWIFNAHATAATDPTMTGWGVTWVEVATFTFSGGTRRITLLAADLSGSSGGVLTIDFATVVQIGCYMMLMHADPVDLSGGVAAAFAQVVTNSGTGTVGSATLASPANSNNRPIAAFMHLANENLVENTTDGWDEMDDISGSGPLLGMNTQSKSDAFNVNASASWVTSAAWGVIAAEVKAQTGGGAANPSVVKGKGASISDLAGISDATALVKTMIRAQADIEGISDSMARVLSKRLTIADVEGLTDAQLVVKMKTFLISDSETIADAQSIVKSMARALNDAAGLVDSISKVSSYKRTQAENATLSDLMSFIKSQTRLLNDLVGLNDSVSRVSATKRSFADVAGLSDSATKVSSHKRSLNDSAGIADAISRIMSWRKTIADIEGLADSATKVLALKRSPADLAGMLDATSRVLRSARSVSDSETLTDVMSFQGTGVIKRSVAETLQLADAVTTIRQLVRVFSDAEGLSDVMLYVHNRFQQRSIADVANLTDSMTRQQTFLHLRSLSDVLNLIDSMVSDLVIRREFNDLAGLADLMEFIGPPRAMGPMEAIFYAATPEAVFEEATPQARITRATPEADTESATPIAETRRATLEVDWE